MQKLKINPGLAAVILVAGLLTGGQTLLTVVVLMFAFCEVDSKVTNIAVKVITFFVGLALFNLLWSGIYNSADGIAYCLQKLCETINNWIPATSAFRIPTTDFMTPINAFVQIADRVITILLIFVKLGFVISLFAGKDKKATGLVGKVQDYITKSLVFINNINGVQQRTAQTTTNTEVPPQNPPTANA